MGHRNNTDHPNQILTAADIAAAAAAAAVVALAQDFSTI
jgi:hypothetical protein